MICIKCHKGSPRIPDAATFLEQWRIRLAFIAQHIGHNRAWGRRWANSYVYALKKRASVTTPEERDAEEALWKEYVGRLS